eukprot:Skav208467  [mRNA]  locus=scaffold1104:258720:260358:+ [translate_table: standard]
MSEVAVQEILEVLSEQGSDHIDTSLLHFLVQSLRDAKVAAAAARGVLQLLSDAKYRVEFQKLGVAAAVSGLHFFGPEMSTLATQMTEILELTGEDPFSLVPVEQAEAWKSFSFDHLGDKVSVKVKLSKANDATRLSSHGWRVWPGAQILSQCLVSRWGYKLKEMDVVGAGPGLVGLVAAALGARVTLTDRCPAVLTALQHSIQAKGDKDLLPALLQKILRPGGCFCACEQLGRSQDEICLLPLFYAAMKERGFIQVLEDRHQFNESDLEFILFEFRAP